MTTSVPPRDPAEPTLLELYLAAHSDSCPMCGYNLHKLRGANCPECGMSIELRIAVLTPRYGAFYTGLIGFATGAGAALFLFGLAIVTVLIRPPGTYIGPEPWELGLMLLIGLGLLVGCVLWIRLSGRIRRLPALPRWSLAVGTWIFWISALAVFFSIAQS